MSKRKRKVKRYRETHHFTLDPDFMDTLEKASKRTNIPASRIIEKGTSKELKRLRRIFARW